MRALILAGGIAGGWVIVIPATAQHPGAIPSPTVQHMVEEALGRGSRVILKRVDYVAGQDAPAGAQGEPGGAVRSKTYIEIDTRPSAGADEEMIRSQERVEEGQREMLKAVEAIGTAQERQGSAMGAIESGQRNAASGSKSAAGEMGAMRGEAAAAGAETGEADNSVQSTEKMLEQIRGEIRNLSGAVSELSSRVDGEGGGAPGGGR